MVFIACTLVFSPILVVLVFAIYKTMLHLQGKHPVKERQSIDNNHSPISQNNHHQNNILSNNELVAVITAAVNTYNKYK